MTEQYYRLKSALETIEVLKATLKARDKRIMELQNALRNS